MKKRRKEEKKEKEKNSSLMESSARHSVCTLVETMVTSGEDQPNTVQLQELKRLCKRSVSKSVKVETHTQHSTLRRVRLISLTTFSRSTMMALCNRCN